MVIDIPKEVFLCNGLLTLKLFSQLRHKPGFDFEFARMSSRRLGFLGTSGKVFSGFVGSYVEDSSELVGRNWAFEPLSAEHVEKTQLTIVIHPLWKIAVLDQTAASPLKCPKSRSLWHTRSACRAGRRFAREAGMSAM
jgi:hypothetical protein